MHKHFKPTDTFQHTQFTSCHPRERLYERRRAKPKTSRNKSLQALHCRAGRLIFNLPRDTPSDVVMELTQWDSIYDLYKLSLVKLFYNIVNDNIPSTISDLAVWHNSPYDLRGYKKAVVPRFSTYFVKNSKSL